MVIYFWLALDIAKMSKEIPIIHSPDSLLHRPKHEAVFDQRLPYGDSINRVTAILRELRRNGFTSINITTLYGLAWVEQVHSLRYLDFLRETSEKFDQLLRAEGVDPTKIHALYPTVFNFQPGWQERNLTLEGRLGLYSRDVLAPITRETYKAAMGSAACAIAGAQLILAGEKAVYSLCRPPGHHVGKEKMGGYCYLNNAAIAVEVLIAGGAKTVAILDIDLHHPNGTQEIFTGRGDIFLASLHGRPEETYPFYSGFAEEKGIGEGEGKTVNLPLPQGTNEEDYQKALDYALGRIRDFHPEILVVSAGFDTHKDDVFNSFLLPTEYYQKVGRGIACLGIPVLTVQEGGYNIKVLGKNVVSYLRGFVKKDLD